MKKKLLMVSFIIFALSLVFISGAKGRSGARVNFDTLNFAGKIYLTTINSGAAELHQIENTKIIKVATINAIAGDYGCRGFIDAVLKTTQNSMFLFLTDGKYVYKYDVTDPGNPMLLKKSNDGTNDRFIGLGKMDNKIYSVSNQGIKIWDENMRVFYNAKFNNSFTHNINFSDKGNFIFNINYDQLEIYDAFSQKLISSIKIEASDNHVRNIYNDEFDSSIYLVDDSMVKQVDFRGNVIKSFKHTSTLGYDIAYTPGDDHLYFSDGIGIVKLRKSDLKPLSWVYTKTFSGSNGWVTGLKVVRDNYGEKIIVFDGHNIIALNQDYKKIGSIIVDNNDPRCALEEPLSLTLDINHATAGSEVGLSGRGFSSGENLSIYLANRKIDSTYADSNGRFSKIIMVPQYSSIRSEFKPGKMDIKILGDNSGKTYSTNFQIDGVESIDFIRFTSSIDKKHGLSGEEVVLSASGFKQRQLLHIYFADKKIDAVYTDNLGSFSKVIVVPDVRPGKYEIKIAPLIGDGHTIIFEVDKNYENIFHWTKRHTN